MSENPIPQPAPDMPELEELDFVDDEPAPTELYDVCKLQLKVLERVVFAHVFLALVMLVAVAYLASKTAHP